MRIIKKCGLAFAFVVALITVLWFMPRVDAQTYATNTTLSSAVSATAMTVTVASATGLTAGSYLYIDTELMQIVSVSSTTATVRRGLAQGGSPASAHASGAIVWVGTGDVFKTYDVAGACTAATQLYVPHINTKNGRIFDCEQSVWMERHKDLVRVRDYTIRDSFDQGYDGRVAAGTAAAGADAEVVTWAGSPLGVVSMREEVAKTAYSFVVSDGVLDLSADDTVNNEGVEFVFDAANSADQGWILAGTQGGCVEASFTVTLIANVDFLSIGIRQNEVMVDAATPASYTLYNLAGIYNSVDGSIFSIETGATSDDSAVNWANGETRALKVCVSKAGVPSAYYSAAYTESQDHAIFPTYVQIPNVSNGTTLTAGTQLVPFLTYLHSSGAGDAGVFVNWVQLTRLP